MSEANPYQSPESNALQGDQAVCTKMNFFSWGQRIGRIRYLAYLGGIYLIFAGLVALMFAVMGVGMSGGNSDALGGIAILLLVVVYIVMFVAVVTLGVRRLHDLDKSGWLWLLFLLPIVNIGMSIYILFFPGSDGANRFGPKPLPNNAGTWIAGLILPLILIVGVLAAVAIPAYQDYVERAQQVQMQNG